MKKTLWFIFTTLSILLIVELLLRTLGFKPHQAFALDDIDCNGVVWNLPYDSMGYVFHEGEFNCIVNEEINFTITQLADLSRKTSEQPMWGKKTIHFYGDSFIWGQALSDNQTLAWKVQENKQELSIKNYGVGAYSSVQSFLLFKENLKKYPKPAEVFLFYSGFLDDRNAFTSVWKALWQDLLIDFHNSKGAFKEGSEFYFPMGKVENDEFQIEYLSEQKINSAFPLRNYSALANRVDVYLNKLADKQKRPREVSKELFKEFNELAALNDIKFKLVLLSEQSLTKEEIDDLENHGIEIIDISFELDQDAHTFYPVDMHPNEEANKIWAQKLSGYIN